MSTPTLYFAYDASLDPDRISSACPGAGFLFTAHYPETRLAFVAGDPDPIPTLLHEPGNTVWGAVFEVPGDEVAGLVEMLGLGRSTRYDHKAVDREGNKHDCLTFVSEQSPDDEPHSPSSEYVDAMIRGARHWSLPAGWVMGLEDLVENPLFS